MVPAFARRIAGLVPVTGMLAFLLLYVIAAENYPGGSQANAYSRGFDWFQNYWCDLLDTRAINGEANTARSTAIAGMLMLCISICTFWYSFPQCLNIARNLRLIIQITGILSMVMCVFLFWRDHDTVLNTASLFGLTAIVCTLIALKNLRWLLLFWLGVLNVLLIGVNNILYYTPGLLVYLPVVQKITFLLFLTWFCWLSLKAYHAPIRGVLN